MAYRKRGRYSRKMAAARAARERKRLDSQPPDYPQELPYLRRRVIIIDYDFGKVVHRIDLYRTGRIDCYRAVADGVTWREMIGWSAVLAGVRKSFIRVHAAR